MQTLPSRWMTLEFLAAEKIAEVAFGVAVELGVAKLAESAIATVKTLREKIKGKFEGNPEAESANRHCRKFCQCGGDCALFKRSHPLRH